MRNEKGQFKKGLIPWNKGKKNCYSEEILKKIGDASRGRKHSEETRKKMSENYYKKFNPKFTTKGIKAWNKGKKFPEKSNENHWRWIKDRTKLKKFNDTNKDRRSSAYKNWRKQVWLRDNFKCRITNSDCNGRIECHHILSYTKYPELRYEVNNGITLCHYHHPRKREYEEKLINKFQKLIKF